MKETTNKDMKVLHIEITQEEFAILKQICQDSSRTFKGQIVSWIKKGKG